MSPAEVEHVSQTMGWSEAARRHALARALQPPSPAQWVLLLDRASLAAGTITLTIGGFCLLSTLDIAWDRPQRLLVALLAEALALAAALRFGKDRFPGRCAHTAAAALLGVVLLLAVPRFYAHPEDPLAYALWCALITPLALWLRFPPLWLIWLVLLNTAATLMLGDPSVPTATALGLLNLSVWIISEQLHHGLPPEVPQVVALLCLSNAAWFEQLERSGSIYARVVWLLFTLASAEVGRRRKHRNLLGLCGVSVLWLLTTVLCQTLTWNGESVFSSLALVALAVAVATAVLAGWIRHVTRPSA